MAQYLTDDDFIQFVGKQESQFLAKPSEFQAETMERFENRSGTLSGDCMPWSKTHDRVRFRPGEVSLWPGINGHGKSMVLGQAIAWMLPETKCLIASMEMKPAATLERMIRQCSGGDQPGKRFCQQWFSWTDGRLWIYDQTDTVAPERIVGMCNYAAHELGIKHIVIDSLMKCGIRGSSDAQYAGQRDFVDRLCWAAKTMDCHIHLVHHMRKGERETTIPDKFDIKGAGEIADMVDNIFICHRNKMKEKKVEKNEQADRYEPDETVTCAKQRNGEWEGVINLYFHHASQQFVSNPDKGAMYWPGQREWTPDNVKALQELYEPGVSG